MKLALLIVVAVVIVAGTAVSYFQYQAWRDNRFDEMIVESADRHNVDPALVKALMMAQAQLNYAAAEGPESRAAQSRGLMLVPADVANKYLEMNDRGPWRYICVNRHFRNHDPAKPEQFTADIPKEGDTTERHPRCKAPGCGQPLVEELLDPATNIEVACWYLGRLNASLSALARGPVPPQLIVAFYRWVPVEEAPTFDPRRFNLSSEQRALLGAFDKAYKKYARQFDERARRAEPE
jgi:hypothetical protein